MRIAFRAACAACAAAFLGFAWLQHNDPDPLLWIAIYGGACLVCAVAATGWLPWRVAGVSAILAAGASLPLLPSAVTAPPRLVFTDMAMHASGVEEAREVLGLWIVAAVLAGIAEVLRRGRG